MLNNLISFIISEYAIVIYEVVAIIILFLIIVRKNKKIKVLKQEVEVNLQRAKNDTLDNMLTNQRKGAQE